MNRIKLIYFVFAVVGVMTIACSLSEIALLLDASNATPVPLPDTFIGENVALVENTWQLVQIIHQGEAVEFEAIAPVTFDFMPEGYLGVRTTDCNFVGYKIVTKPEQQYGLIQSTSTAIYCGELRQFQIERVSEAVKATNAYKIQGNQLLLTGDNVQLLLEIDTLYTPNSPVATPTQS
jgi:hypothetical protein